MTSDSARVIAYVSTYSYAAGPANGVRSQGVLTALSNLGHRVEVMPGQADPAPAEDRGGRSVRRTVLPPAVTMGAGVPDWLDSLPRPPELVWLYGLDVRFSARVFRWARRNHVPVICEVVDWYELRDLEGLAPKLVLALTNWVAMPWARRRAEGFVVASRVLGGYFSTRSGRSAQRVPAVVPDLPISTAPPAEPMVIGYVGSPGRRDGPTLENLRVVAETWTGGPLEIHVAGIPAPTPSWSPATSVHVRFHGRIPRQEAVALVSRCHATVLQRRADRRFAQAGFPSKLAESMTLGTPCLTNRTSDIEDYVTDGIDAVLVEDHSADALLRAIERLAASPIDRSTVRAAAREAFSVEAAASRLSAVLGEWGPGCRDDST